MNTSIGPRQPSFSSMVVLSLLFHFFALSILFYFSDTKNRLITPPVYTVDLLTLPSGVKGRLDNKKKTIRIRRKERRSRVKKVQRHDTASVKKKTLKKKIKPLENKPIVTNKIDATPQGTGITKKKARDIDKLVAVERELKAREDEIKKLFERVKKKKYFNKEVNGLKKKMEFDKAVKESLASERLNEKVGSKDLQGDYSKNLEDIKDAFKRIRERSSYEERVRDIEQGLKPGKAGKTEGANLANPSLKGLKGDFEVKGANNNKIEEVFEKLIEREKKRRESIKRIARLNKEYKIPFKPREWSIEVEGTASVKRGSISVEVASAIAELISQRIRTAWELDKFVSLREDYPSLRTIVTIKVGENGSILDIVVEKESKDPAFQKSVVDAIKKSDPLPIEGLNIDGGFELGLTFSPGEVK